MVAAFGATGHMPAERFGSSRPQVMPKKNRSATIRALKVDGVTPVSVMWS